MAERKSHGKAAAGTSGARRKPGPKKATKAELKKRREHRAAAKEAARLAAMNPADVIAEQQRGVEQQELRGAAKTVQNAQVYKRVFRDWTLGWSERDLSEKYELSERRIRMIVDELRGTELTRLGVGDPLFSVKFAQRLVLMRSAAVSQYTRLAEEASSDQPQVRLGYLKLRDQALTAFTQLVQELGWLPRHLGTINTMMDAMQMAEALLEVMQQRQVPEETQQAVVEAIELRVVRRSGGGLALAGVGPDLIGTAVDVEVRDGMGPDEGDDVGAAEGGREGVAA